MSGVVSASARAGDRAAAKSQVEKTILGYYQEMEAGYAQKDTARIFSHFDPSHTFGKADAEGGTDLATNRKNLEKMFGEIKSIRVKIQLEATDIMENTFYVRYKQDHEVAYPLKKPYSIWYEAEDKWQQRNGRWVLVSTKVVNDAVSQAKSRLEIQK
jgi:hypothetical protein